MNATNNNLFVAIFEDEVAGDVAEELEESPAIADTHQVNPTVLVVRSVAHDPAVVSSLARMSDERSGVVFRLNGSYQGFFYKSLWDWLKEGRE